MIFCTQYISNENSILLLLSKLSRSNPTTFCTCPHSWVVLCAKLCNDTIAISRITTKTISHQFSITGEKRSVKCTIDQYTHLCTPYDAIAKVIYYSIYSSIVCWLRYASIINSLTLSVAYGIRYVAHHWFRQWLVACSAPNHYLNQCRIIVKWTLQNKLNDIFIKI